MTLVNPDTGEVVRLNADQARFSGLVNPHAERYPLMTGAELEELANDIAANGQLEPIWLDVDGALLDGRNRLAACRLAEVQPYFAVYEGEDIEAFIVSKNEHRRHLTQKQQKELRQARIAAMREKGMSQTAIANELGVSQATVARESMSIQDESSETSDPQPTVKDGKVTRFGWSESRQREFLAAYDGAETGGKALIAQGYGLTNKQATALALRLRKKFAAETPTEASQQKRDRIRELASTSMTAEQIGAEVGLKPGTVRTYANDMGVELQGDKAMSNRRRVEATEVMERLITGSEISPSVLDLIGYPKLDVDRIDVDRIDDWVSSLDASITVLNTIRKRLKELTR